MAARTLPPHAPAIAARYHVEGTTLIARDARLSPVEIGDRKQPAFHPQIKIPRWHNTVNTSIRLVLEDPAEVTYDTGVVVYRTSTVDARFYPIDDLESADGHEFEVRLLSAPATPVLTFTLQAKGGQWWRQPVMAYRSAHPPFHPDAYRWEPNGRGGERRQPERVAGSWIYDTDLSGDYTALGGHNYRNGKALHVYRPWAEDAKGVRVWCDLDIDGAAGLMTITVPQDFLDGAVYPVLVDPTFGYSGTAASDDNASNSNIWCRATTTPVSAGALTSVTGRGRNKGSVTGTASFDPAIYSDSAGAPGTNLASSQSGGTTFGASDADITTNLTYASIGSGTQYWLAFHDGASLGNDLLIDCFFKYDASGTSNLGFTTPGGGNPTAAWPGTAAATVVGNEKVYIFGTYSAAGALPDGQRSQTLPVPSLGRLRGVDLLTWTNNNLQNTLAASNQPDPFKTQAWALPLPPRTPAALLSWSQNLLQSTLAPAVTINPFRNEQFPLPGRVRYRAHLYQWEQYFVVDDNAPFMLPQVEVPAGRIYPVSLRTWTSNLLQTTLAPAAVVNPFVAPDLPNPPAPRALQEIYRFTATHSPVLESGIPIITKEYTNPVLGRSTLNSRTWTQNLLQTTLTPSSGIPVFVSMNMLRVPLGPTYPVSLRTHLASLRLIDEPKIPLPVLGVPPGARYPIDLRTWVCNGFLCLNGPGVAPIAGILAQVNTYHGIGFFS